MPKHEIAYAEGMRCGFLLGVAVVLLAYMLFWCWKARKEIWSHFRFWVLACLNRKEP